MPPDPRLIVALDYPDAEPALALARRLDPAACRLKVGLELYIAEGPQIVERLHDLGFEIFLDLKLHDIPTTVGRACARAARLGVWMVNVHALGGADMIGAARAALDAAARPPLLTAVTLLTSHGPEFPGQVGLASGVAAGVERLARLAHEAGADGVVCAPVDAATLRAGFGPGFVLVTPGVRPLGSATDDQARAATAAEAIAAGSNYLVVGRPVTRAADPVAALAALVAEIGQSVPD